MSRWRFLRPLGSSRQNLATPHNRLTEKAHFHSELSGEERTKIRITELRMSGGGGGSGSGGSGGSGSGGGSEALDALRSEKDGETARPQLHKEIEPSEIMSARTSLNLLNLATMGDAVRMTLQDSVEEVSVARLRSLGAEIEKAKASICELRREILEAKRERIEVLEGLDGFTESRPVVHKQVGSRSTEKRRSMFNGVIVGIAALVIALSILGVSARGDKNRK